MSTSSADNETVSLRPVRVDSGALHARQDQILEFARERGLVQVDALACELAVTPQTIRRDLNAMCQRRLLQRVHGGAVLQDGVSNLGYQTRRGVNAEAKARIGKLAASLIPDDSTLFINIGTTTEQVAQHLVNRQGLLVVTNNMNVVESLRVNETISIHIAGGQVRNEDGGIVGEATADFMDEFKLSNAIIGVSAVSADGTLLDFDRQEVLVARSIIRNSEHVTLVLDGSKFDRHAPMRIADIECVNRVVTDREPPERIRALCVKHGVQVLVASAGEGHGHGA